MLGVEDTRKSRLVGSDSHLLKPTVGFDYLHMQVMLVKTKGDLICLGASSHKLLASFNLFS